MTDRLTEAWRLAVAEHRYTDFQNMRKGSIVRCHIPEDVGFSDGLPRSKRHAQTGYYQLRYSNPKEPGPAMYGVFGRENDRGAWRIVEGPWECGKGPFDREKTT